ncbi:MAG TPA: glucosaminidase domain-containing protein [Saprospiraceae bacterium]|nr:glucosaminidase domain-containing protein [Saprospiraceae bacterium]MCB9327182.1 glucosaminidase domain-containing protein [Lewinellaceae bacterium]HPK10167.1 glucosaminidase domain-containing protein [Saprospiraceae bacterium]HPQ20583.1 glucosaminidase domain-containing protein [Saprospiraceae bacterium]HRX28340.1 glucosaminidase domain-containing protein [Saprospiraceae bacterium]
MKILSVLIVMVSSVMSLCAKNPVAEEYIAKYKQIAEFEMKRTGIPASVKMAQAILESDMGRSDLAREANNHFGIKCGGSWDGKNYYKHDDDYNHDGTLIESCFRHFEDAEASFMEHSNFLTDPKKESRYGFLFNLSPDDYKGWCNGLRDAGYATDSKYPKKLIDIIEKYNLYDLDNEVLSENTAPIVKSNSSESKSESILKYQIQSEGRLQYIVAMGGESYQEIASAVGLDLEDILNFNEAFDFRNAQLNAEDKIYIKPKMRTFKGIQEKHRVVEGETLHSISQLYGIKIATLRSKNKIQKGEEPLVGEYIYLQGTPKKSELPTHKTNSVSDEDKYLWN